MKVLGIIVAVIAAMFLSALWSGWVLTVLWGWFIVPVFSTPALSLAYAIGLSLVVGYLTHQVQYTEKGRDPWKVFSEAVSMTIAKPAVFLGIGFIVTLFI